MSGNKRKFTIPPIRTHSHGRPDPYTGHFHYLFETISIHRTVRHTHSHHARVRRICSDGPRAFFAIVIEFDLKINDGNQLTLQIFPRSCFKL